MIDYYYINYYSGGKNIYEYIYIYIYIVLDYSKRCYNILYYMR